MRAAWGQGPQFTPAHNSHCLAFFLIRAASPKEPTGLLTSRAASCPTPKGRTQWFLQLGRPRSAGRELGGRGPPLCPCLPSPAWCSSMAGIWKLFLFTQHHQDNCRTLCSSEEKRGIPAGPFPRLHAKQPAVSQGASGPCYISAEEALPSVQTGHPGLSACARGWGTSLVL